MILANIILSCGGKRQWGLLQTHSPGSTEEAWKVTRLTTYPSYFLGAGSGKELLAFASMVCCVGLFVLFYHLKII